MQQSGSSQRVKPVLAGFFGGIAPDLLQATTQAVGSAARGLLLADVTFWLGAIVPAGLGALLVYFYDERSPKKALALGAAGPALIFGLSSGLPSQRGDLAVPHVDAASVSAESPRADPAGLAGRTTFAAGWVTVQAPTVRVAILVVGFQQATHLDLVAVQGRSGEKRYRLAQASTTTALPNGTTELYVIADGAKSNHVSLGRNAGGSVTMPVTVRQPAEGFRRALGLRGSRALKVTVAVGSKSQTARVPEPRGKHLTGRPSGAHRPNVAVTIAFRPSFGRSQGIPQVDTTHARVAP